MLDLERPSDSHAQRVLETARALVHESHAEAIVMGCAGMSTLRDDLGQALGVPVIDGVASAVQLVGRHARTTEKLVNPRSR